MLRESHLLNEAAWFYSVSTAIYFPVLVLGLFLSDAYLQAGHNSYLPVYVFLIVAELIKYTYNQLVYHKDISYSPKQGFKLFSIILYFVKQIKIVELFRCALVLVGFTSIVFVFAILFGAEVLSKHEETLMFSCLITVSTAFPVCLNQGVIGFMHLVNGSYGSDVFSLVLVRNIQFTVLGAWLGAFVIPLDWGREWQVWPIPCSLGSMLGFGTAQMFSLFEIFTKYGIKSMKLNNKYR